jgi:hypothetical protein
VPSVNAVRVFSRPTAYAGRRSHWSARCCSTHWLRSCFSRSDGQRRRRSNHRGKSRCRCSSPGPTQRGRSSRRLRNHPPFRNRCRRHRRIAKPESLCRRQRPNLSPRRRSRYRRRLNRLFPHHPIPRHFRRCLSRSDLPLRRTCPPRYPTLPHRFRLNLWHPQSRSRPLHQRRPRNHPSMSRHPCRRNLRPHRRRSHRHRPDRPRHVPGPPAGRSLPPGRPAARSRRRVRLRQHLRLRPPAVRFRRRPVLRSPRLHPVPKSRQDGGVRFPLGFSRTRPTLTRRAHAARKAARS